MDILTIFTAPSQIVDKAAGRDVFGSVDKAIVFSVVAWGAVAYFLLSGSGDRR